MTSGGDDADIDGAPLDETDGDDDHDAGPLDGMALLRGAQKMSNMDMDYDGVLSRWSIFTKYSQIFTYLYCAGSNKTLLFLRI